jgi:hypothetical protein
MLVTAQQTPLLITGKAFSIQSMVFLDPAYRFISEKININHILRGNPDLLLKWSPPQPAPHTSPSQASKLLANAAPPFLTFVAENPLQVTLCQNKAFADNFQWKQISPNFALSNPWAALDQHQPCKCYLHQTAIDPQVGHIVTCNYESIVQDPTLLRLLQRGPKFRCPLLVSTTDDEMDTYVEHLVEHLHLHLQKRRFTGNLHTWTQTWLAAVKTQVQAAVNQFRHTMHNTSAHIQQNETIARMYTLGRSGKIALSNLCKHFAITTVDKTSDLFAVICKNHLYKSIIIDLSNSQFFNILPVTTTVENIITDHKSFLHPLTLFPTKHTAHKLGYYSTIAKLHKNPPAFRFITCSQGCSTEQLNLFLTSFLRNVETFAHKTFHDKLSSLSMIPARQASWILRSSFEVITLIKHFNIHITGHNPPPKLHATVVDFERLYTHINLLDLVSKLSNLTRSFFLTHPNHLLKVYLDKTYPAQWVPLNSTMPGASGKDSIKGQYFVFSPEIFHNMFSWMVHNNHFTFAGRTFHQTNGIAMGSNAAVLIANLYLFTYELDFIQQDAFIKPHADATQDQKKDHNVARKVLKLFMHTGRFVDDALFLANKFIKALLKQPNPAHAATPTTPGYFKLHSPNTYLKGIYPHYLNLTFDQSPKEHFMDIQLDITNGTSPMFTTRIYDKRDHELNRLPTKSYVHPHSDSPLWSKLGIIPALFDRYSRLALDVNDFYKHAARLLHRMLKAGHSRVDMCLYFERGVRRAAPRYALKEPVLRNGIILMLQDPEMSFQYFG